MRPCNLLLLILLCLVPALTVSAQDSAPAGTPPAPRKETVRPAPAAADAAATTAGIVITPDAPEKADLTVKGDQAVLTVKEEEIYLEGKVKSVPAAVGGSFQSIDLVVAVLDEYDNEVKIVYHVVPDDAGLRLAREMSEKIAEVTCQIQNRGTKEKPDFWIAVRRFVVVDEATN